MHLIMIIAKWQADMLLSSPPFSQTIPWETKPIMVDRDDLPYQDMLLNLPWVDRYRILELLMARTSSIPVLCIVNGFALISASGVNIFKACFTYIK